MPQTTRQIEGKPGTTTRVAASDSAQTLADAIVYDSNGNARSWALVTVEDNNIRYAWATNPTNANGTSADTGHLLQTGTSLKLGSPEELADFRFINAVAGSDAVLQVTPSGD